MHIKDVPAGKQFKYTNNELSGRIGTVYSMPLNNEYVYYTLNNEPFKIFRTKRLEEEVLTLQPVTKTVNKYILKEFKDIPLGGKCQTYMDASEHASLVKARQVNWDIYGTYSPENHTFLLRDDHNRLYVEEEVTEVTEEWV